MTVKTRIPPSPTGNLHIGTARMALFNYLYARQHNGSVALRLEDTDRERSKPEFEEDIITGLSWLGISWDGDPVRQSARIELYRSYAKKLLEKGLAFTEPGKYGGDAIILKHQDRDYSFVDLIRGEISFSSESQADIVLIKSDGTPSYQLAVTVDDYEQGITHVIRGEDLISSTPRQLAIQEALDFPRPTYVHLPLILGPDRSKLSKRHGATSINEYKARGYLAEAMINFMALLGWNPGTDKEIFSLEELVESFDLERVQKGSAIFNADKLNWINERHIQNLPADILATRVRSYLKEFYPDTDTARVDEKFVDFARERMTTLDDSREELVWFLPPEYEASLLIWKNTDAKKTIGYLKVLREKIDHIEAGEFEKSKLNDYIMPFADERGRGAVLWPLRVALSGKEKSPGPFELMELIGKAESVSRIDNAIGKLGKNSAENMI